MMDKPRGITARLVEWAATEPPFQKKLEALDRIYRLLFDDQPNWGAYGKLLKQADGSLVDAANILFYVASLTPLEGNPIQRALAVSKLRERRVAAEQQAADDEARSTVQQQIDALESLAQINPQLLPQVEEFKKRHQAA